MMKTQQIKIDRVAFDKVKQASEMIDLSNDYIEIIGRCGSGKTCLSLCRALLEAQKEKSVLYVNFENPRVNIFRLIRRMFGDDYAVPKNFKVLIGPEDSDLIKTIEDTKFDFVFIDGFEFGLLMKRSKGFAFTDEENRIEYFKTLAKDNNVTIIVTKQARRDANPH